jgi:hypothetical protein
VGIIHRARSGLARGGPEPTVPGGRAAVGTSVRQGVGVRAVARTGVRIIAGVVRGVTAEQ